MQFQAKLVSKVDPFELTIRHHNMFPLQIFDTNILEDAFELFELKPRVE